MLILSRKVDEEILIGGIVRIVVVSMRGDRVRLGIDAPPEIEVLRSELEPGGPSDVDAAA